MPWLVERIATEYPDIELHITTGNETATFRQVYGLEKTHDIDAYCIACSSLDIKEDDIDIRVKPQDIRQFRRQDRQCCHKEMIDRKYYLDGKLVATNRNKRTDQKTDSLKEFRQTHTKQEVSRLVVKKHPAQYKDRSRIMPGAVMQYKERLTKQQTKDGIKPLTKRFVMLRSDGRHEGKPDCYISVSGERFSAGRCTVVAHNSGLVFI